ncbi:MAG: hypothetical protein AAFX93_03360 [Verrucomicrobiota bacterium]
MPRKKRKANLPLIEVIIVSLVLHVLALLVLGGINIWTAMKPEEPELEAPPVVEAPVEQQEQKVRLKKSLQNSSRPKSRIVINNPTQMNLPELNVDIPTIDSKVAVGTGTGTGTGLGRGFGSGGIDFSKSAVDFFGIKSEGERVTFIIDASRYMLEDKKGGIPAYTIIKQEITRMVNGLKPGTLFNIMFVDGKKVYTFSERMLPATNGNKAKVSGWIDPVNAKGGRTGISGNVAVRNTDRLPMKADVAHWARGIQVAMEQNSDAIFMIVPSWQWHGIKFESPQAKLDWQKAQGWGPEQENAWKNATKKAQNWLKEENKRRSSKGQPPKVVVNDQSLITDLMKLGVIKKGLKYPPGNSYSREDVIKHVVDTGRDLYKERNAKTPEVNVVLFLGADEDGKNHKDVDSFKTVARKNRGGKLRVLEGEGDLMKQVNRANQG